MKVAIITDTHFGARGDSQAFTKYFERFFAEQFFPEIEHRQITTVLHLGDLVDRRKYVNYQTLQDVKRIYMDELVARELHGIFIPGNHDSFFRNTLAVNAIQELFGSYPIEIHNDPAEILLGDLKVLLVPWICDENREATKKLLRETDAQICMGHLELAGFEMYRGMLAEHGEDILEDLKRFDMVMSGHYHHRSSVGNVHYLGSPYELIWSDYDDARGFHVFDTDTRQLEFIQNPLRMHRKIFYGDRNKQVGDIVGDGALFEGLRDTIVKVVVTSKTNPYWFDLFLNKIDEAQPADVAIVEDHLNADVLVDDEVIHEAEDTLAIFKKSIQTLDNSLVDPVLLERYVSDLYKEALQIA